MSKAFAFAGARVGYLVADPKVIDAMMIVRLPYHLSSITQAVAEVALDFKDELLAGVGTLIESRDLMIDALASLGLRTVESEANFILFTGFSQDAKQLWSDLLKRGVLIRDVGLSGHLRVTIGNEAENTLFINALKELI
jgi:histidinol-phosphate aminotransferase